MAKVKKSIKKSPTKKRSSRISRTVYGIEHEFVLITGGGFVVIVLGLFLFFH